MKTPLLVPSTVAACEREICEMRVAASVASVSSRVV